MIINNHTLRLPFLASALCVASVCLFASLSITQVSGGARASTGAEDALSDSANLVEIAEFPLFGHSSEGANVQIFINVTTKDSVASVIYYGEMGRLEYIFIFNKKLIDAARADYTYTSHITDTWGEVASIEKSTLKTSKEAEKDMKETFLEIRKEFAEGMKDGAPVKRGFDAIDDGDKATDKGMVRYYYDLAVKKFDNALRLDPPNAVARAGRGRAYLRKGDNKQAIADFSEALRLNPKDAVSISNRGRAYARTGDYDRAVADFEEAAKLAPENELIKQNLERAKRREKGL
jgi:tetratricopeptide (TPR) repeat protein